MARQNRVKSARRVKMWSPLRALGRRPYAVQEPEEHKRYFKRETVSYRKSWIRKKWILWDVIQRGLREQLESACMSIQSDSEDRLQKSNSVKFTSGMHYRTIQDVNDGFGDRTGSCREFPLSRDDPRIRSQTADHRQYGDQPSSCSQDHLSSMESKFQSPPRLETMATRGWSDPVAHTVAWTSYDTTIRILLQRKL